MRHKVPTEDSLDQAVRAAGIDVPPVWLEEVSSTNDEARRLAREGAPDWTVVAAEHQTMGRGRRGRTWLDAPGRSLLCSVVLRSWPDPSDAHLLTLGAAVAMIDAAGLQVLAAKWPNDLVVGDRKCGGILTEAEVRSGVVHHLIVGVGVNVSAGPEELPDGVQTTATSLAIEGAAIGRMDLLTRFLRSFRRLLETHRLDGRLVARYRLRCRTLGRQVRALTTSGDRIEGRAVDVDDRGSLLVARDSSIERVAFGEVQHLT